ncbi:ROK family protein [Bacillus inaquosorum]|nr:ROK family protein [Bacillus inaquosorum]
MNFKCVTEFWILFRNRPTNILNTFNPQAIILRNSIIESHPMVLNSIKSEVSARVYSQLGKEPMNYYHLS